MHRLLWIQTLFTFRHVHAQPQTGRGTKGVLYPSPSLLDHILLAGRIDLQNIHTIHKTGWNALHCIEVEKAQESQW